MLQIGVITCICHCEASHNTTVESCMTVNVVVVKHVQSRNKLGSKIWDRTR